MHILLTVALLAASSCSVFACSCLPKGAPLTELSKADAVFLAITDEVTVVKTEITQTGLQVPVSYTAAKLRVLQSWKGIDKAAVTVTTPVVGVGSCGFPFLVGERFLIYAHIQRNLLTGQDELITSICSRTALEREAKTDVNQLGQPQRKFGSSQEH